jgi:hypothetical protein
MSPRPKRRNKGGRLSGPSASDQTIQAIREFHLRARQKSTRHTRTQHHVVGGLVLTLSRHMVIIQSAQPVAS